MRVLMQSRKTLFTVAGGDTIQIIKTAEALRIRGCIVDISTDLEPDVSGYDMVHLFNLTRPQETYLQAANAKRQGKKVALSTIYVDFSEYDQKGRGSLARIATKMFSPEAIEYIKTVMRALKNRELNKGTIYLLSHGFKKLQSQVLDAVDILLPNSESEMKRVHENFVESNKIKYVVVPNGVDLSIFDAHTTTPSRSLIEKYQGCVLSVARIERLKNQLNLVRAMKDLPWDLLIIGKQAPNHKSYFDKIKIEAGPNVHFIEHIDHELLPQYYKLAKVHALVSWTETTGLSSLEAGAMGCRLVITRKGDTYDYFGEHAFYCEPDDVQSIKDAIIRAYVSTAPPDSKSHIIENYTWENAAEATLKGYAMVLSQ